MKHRGLEQYIRTVSDLQISDTAQADMMRRLGVSEAEVPAVKPVRQHKISRLETLARAAAVFFICLSVGIMAGIAVNGIRRAGMSDAQRTERLLMQYIENYRGGTMNAEQTVSLLLFQECRESQLDMLRKVQSVAQYNPEHAAEVFSLWSFVRGAVTQQQVLRYFQECPPEEKPVRMMDLEFDPETRRLSFLLLNTADAEAVFAPRAEISAEGETESCVLMQENGLCWLRDYFSCEMRQSDSGQTVLAIPAHGAACVSVEVPARIDVTAMLTQLSLFAPDSADTPVCTRNFTVTENAAALSQAEQLHLLGLALADSNA